MESFLFRFAFASFFAAAACVYNGIHNAGFGYHPVTLIVVAAILGAVLAGGRE